MVSKYGEYNRLQGPTRQAYNRAYLKANKTAMYEASKNLRLRVRREGIEAYGGKCSCCGESCHAFLTIEHINGRDGDTRTGYRAWAAAKRLGWPSDFTVLCWNCNCAKGIYGSCPHTWSEGMGPVEVEKRVTVLRPKNRRYNKPEEEKDDDES